MYPRRDLFFMKKSNTPQVFFSLAQAKDLALLQKLCLETFRHTYEHLNEAAPFEAYITKAFSLPQLKKDLETPSMRYYLLWENEICVGYFKLNFGKTKLDLPTEKTVELERIYLLSSFQGKGYGQRLIQQVETVVASANYQFIWLGVWSENPKAIRFYEKNGFSKIGELDFYMGPDRQLDFLMHKEIIS